MLSPVHSSVVTNGSFAPFNVIFDVLAQELNLVILDDNILLQLEDIRLKSLNVLFKMHNRRVLLGYNRLVHLSRVCRKLINTCLLLHILLVLQLRV